MYKYALKWYNFEHEFNEIFEYGVKAGWFYPVDEAIWKIWYDYFKVAECWEDAYRLINPAQYKLEVSYFRSEVLERRREHHIRIDYNARHEFKMLRKCEKRLTENKRK